MIGALVVVAAVTAVRAVRVVQEFADAAFERFGADGDRGQRVVDFVGHAGRQKADAGELLVADHLLGALLDLAVQIVANRAESQGHVVHRPGQFRHLVVRLQLHVIVEIAPGHFPRAADQNLQRPEDPAVEEPHEDGENQRRQGAGDPQSDQQRVILPADFRGKTLQRRSAGAWAGRRP